MPTYHYRSAYPNLANFRVPDNSPRIGFAPDRNLVEAVFRNYCSVTVIGAEVELP